ncbi:hypothetical protein NE237_006164 [Protea cynaroides]|uniref:Uncharacterized protein n=1 Tax=Protea cynaroides TaxID=273540 RepID=A0A9Q0QV60_9MAGN|nr:hypothetical protein NE237_006164 [Protea cynaroides]
MPKGAEFMTSFSSSLPFGATRLKRFMVFMGPSPIAALPIRRIKRKLEIFSGASSSTSSTSTKGNGGGGLRRDRSLSHDELNHRVEAFIKNFNDEIRLQRQKLDKHYMEDQGATGIDDRGGGGGTRGTIGNSGDKEEEFSVSATALAPADLTSNGVDMNSLQEKLAPCVFRVQESNRTRQRNQLSLIEWQLGFRSCDLRGFGSMSIVFGST